MDSKTAINHAISRLLAQPWTTVKDRQCVEQLRRIVEQKGCQQFDPACVDGSLVHLMDIAIDG